MTLVRVTSYDPLRLHKGQMAVIVSRNMTRIES